MVGTIIIHGIRIYIFIHMILFTGEQVFILDHTGIHGVAMVIIPGTVPITTIIRHFPMVITARIITTHTILVITVDITTDTIITTILTEVITVDKELHSHQIQFIRQVMPELQPGNHVHQYMNQI
jgi:hypothetical protein